MDARAILTMLGLGDGGREPLQGEEQPAVNKGGAGAGFLLLR